MYIASLWLPLKIYKAIFKRLGGFKVADKSKIVNKGRDKNDSYEALVRAVTLAAYRQFDNYVEGSPESSFDTRVLHTYPDAIVLMDTYSEKLYEASYLISNSEVVFSSLREVKEEYVLKRARIAGIEIDIQAEKAVKNAVELGGPIVMKNEAQQIALAPVLVPGEEDSDGEVLTSEKIQEVAHNWLAHYQNVDYMHTLNNTAVPVESYILPADMEVDMYGDKTIVPKGSWILGAKMNDDTWAGVMDGTLRGFSVMGVKKSVFESAFKSEDKGKVFEGAVKRTLLEDLGEDWVATHVSIVDQPAVPKAKFFSFKRAEDKKEDLINDKSSVSEDNLLVSEKSSEKSFSLKEAVLKFISGLNKKEENSVDKNKENNTGISKDEIVSTIAEAVKTSVETAMGDTSNRITTLETEIASIKSALKTDENSNTTPEGSTEEGAGEGEPTNAAGENENSETGEGTSEPVGDSAQKSGEESESKDSELEAFKSQIVERLNSIDQALSKKGITVSKGLNPATADEVKDTSSKGVLLELERDSFGRSLKRAK